jgi:hypothetical protein
VTASEIVARVARERRDMTVIDFAEVGLPCWYILARCDVLAKKPISVIDEAVMKAISLGVTGPSDLQLLLGLDDLVFEAAAVGLLSEGWARGAPDQPLELTEAGTEILESAVEIVSEERVVPIHYDGLARRPIASFDNAIKPRRAQAEGLREIPPTPAYPPDIRELQRSRGELIRILRTLRRGRDQESELLAIRGFDRRERIYRPAIAVLLAADRSQAPLHLALAIDGEPSLVHETAFANAGQIERLGLERTQRTRRRRSLPLPGPKALHSQLDVSAEQAARERIYLAESVVEESPGDRGAKAELRDARRQLGSLSPRTVLPHEHQRLLEAAIDSARSRLLIRGGGVTRTNLDRRMLKKLEAAAGRGVAMRVAVDLGTDTDAAKALARLAEDRPSLIIEREVSEAKESILLSDDRFVVLGRYPWLGFLGDAKRVLGDRRSMLSTDRARIDEVWQSLDGRPV